MRISPRVSARMVGMILSAALATSSLPAFAVDVHRFDIPAEEAAAAVRDFGAQAHVQILVAGDNVKGKKLHAVSGNLTTEDALNTLLSGSGLTHRYVGDHSVAVLPVAQSLATGSPGDSQPGGAGKEGQGSSPSPFRVAQASAGQAADTAAVDRQANEPEKRNGLQEVIVTAEKKSESLLQVPVPVTAISAAGLTENNQVRLQDYYTQVPGLMVSPGDYTGGASAVTIRGITTGATGYGTNPTVAIMIDDVPYGGSTALGGGGVPPDLDPSELTRIEVLRGPQGTLYGASSIGGLIKYVTADPSVDGFSGHIQADTDAIHNAGNLGYGVRGSVNVPVTDTFAVRIGGFGRTDPGYVDDVATGANGVNRERVDGGRLSGLWKPSELFSAKFSALFQDSRRSGGDSVDLLPGLGDLQTMDLPYTGVFNAKNQAYSLNLNATLGTFQLTSLSGYNVDTIYTNWDLSPLLGGLTQAVYGVTGTPWEANNKLNKFSQEVRLSTPIGERLNWLFGVFYTDERVKHDEQFHAVYPNGAVIALTEDTAFSTTYKEYAAFTDLTIDITDKFNVQLGGRVSHNQQTYAEVDTGPFTPDFFLGRPSPLRFPEVDTSETPVTYLLTPQYKFSPDLMVYARLASGYRPGGPNFEASALGLPTTFESDKTKNYEIGTKGQVFDHLLSFDASLYYIDWKNIEVYLVDPVTGNGYYANGSAAKSEGAELSVEARPVGGLKLGAWVAWDNAILTKSLPPGAIAYGVAGDRLPGSPRFSSNFSVDEEFPLVRSATGFVGGSLSYIGDRVDIFTYNPQRQNLPGFAQTDLRAGLKNDSWSLTVFANNVTDKRGLLSGGLGYSVPYTFHIIQPRTIGLSVNKTF
jgi:iron complex outermembrane recepter protein